VSVKLQTPAGGVVSTSEERAARLLRQGFKLVEEKPTPKKRGRPRKTETEGES